MWMMVTIVIRLAALAITAAHRTLTGKLVRFRPVGHQRSPAAVSRPPPLPRHRLEQSRVKELLPRLPLSSPKKSAVYRHLCRIRFPVKRWGNIREAPFLVVDNLFALARMIAPTYLQLVNPIDPAGPHWCRGFAGQGSVRVECPVSGHHRGAAPAAEIVAGAIRCGQRRAKGQHMSFYTHLRFAIIFNVGLGLIGLF
jgi:hypothetical protein